MSYCDLDDLKEQIPEDELIGLSDDAAAGIVDESVISRAIADADAVVDAYCQGLYTVPLTPVPAMIRRVSVDIAIYNLYSRRGDSAPDIRQDRYKEAVRFLEKVAAGKIGLGVTTPASSDTNNSVEFVGNDRIFTRDKMAGF
ncbi:MAG: DUF1320 domain-containing protein [Spirochaetales bacterium]|jgi:phage gp36-like protein|nr:DUF1320 domain-containing protein [Spirochaetales bacterium]